MGARRTTTFILRIIFIVAVGLSFAFGPKPASAAGACGTGTWTAGNLEIHHIDIGQGDSALIVGPTGKSLLLDAGETAWNSSAKAQIIGPYIEAVLGCKSLDYVLISHFHLDHTGYVGYGGLWHLIEIQGFTVGTTLVRDYNNYLGDASGTLTNWKTYLEGPGQAKLHPTTAVEGTSQVDLGAGVTFDIVALDGNGAILAGDFHGDANPPSENDYSIGAVLSYGDFDEWLGGDLDGQYEVGFGYTYHDIELSAAPEVGDVDVYKANHHGSSRSSRATFINQLDPEVSILSLGNGNTYGHPAQETMDRLLATSTVYLTERGDTNTNIGSAIVAGNIVIKTSDGSAYTVNGTPFTATEPTRTDLDGDGYFAEADPSDSDSGLVPAPHGGCGPNYQTCSSSCQATAGQVVINEVLPSPSSGPEWVELYNTTASTINIGYCVIDDIAAGSPAYHIPGSTLIPAHGFWAVDQITYFNNAGDDVRFLKEDAMTLLDSFTYGSTGADLSWYRLPDGGSWAGSPTLSTSKGQSNGLSFDPFVISSLRATSDPTSAGRVDFSVAFSKPVTGVDVNDFALTTGGLTGASVAAVNGSGTTYTVTVHTGFGNGTIRLDVLDDDSIQDASNHPLGGVGTGNGNFTSGEIYTVKKRLTIRSVGTYDGWVLESAETSNRGGTMNAGATTFNVGDNASNGQYRAILHFNTSSLPDTAVITQVVLKIKKQGQVGTNPFTTHMKIAADIRKGFFSTAALQLIDFQSAASRNAAGLIANNPQAGGWHFTKLNAIGYPFLNLTGITQFRLRFQLDDNNDLNADFLKFFSGNATTIADRPVLIVDYYVP